jgi:hypothetical protein
MVPKAVALVNEMDEKGFLIDEHTISFDEDVCKCWDAFASTALV